MNSVRLWDTKVNIRKYVQFLYTNKELSETEMKNPICNCIPKNKISRNKIFYFILWKCNGKWDCFLSLPPRDACRKGDSDISSNCDNSSASFMLHHALIIPS